MPALERRHVAEVRQEEEVDAPVDQILDRAVGDLDREAVAALLAGDALRHDALREHGAHAQLVEEAGVERPQRVDRQGERDADDAVRARRERLRVRDVAREELLAPPGHVIDGLTLLQRLPAPRPRELGAAPPERVAPAVHGEVADRAAVVAGLAGELVLADDLLADERLEVEAALGQRAPRAASAAARRATPKQPISSGSGGTATGLPRSCAKASGTAGFLATPPWSAIRSPTGRLPTTRFR